MTNYNGDDLVNMMDFETKFQEMKTTDDKLKFIAQEMYRINCRCTMHNSTLLDHNKRLKLVENDNKWNKWLVAGLWAVVVATITAIALLFWNHITEEARIIADFIRGV
jgi:hypothetical protein